MHTELHLHQGSSTPSQPTEKRNTPINVVPGEQHQDAKPTKSSVCPGKPCIIIVKLLLTRERRCSNKSAALSGLLLAAPRQAGCPAPHTHNQPHGAGSRMQRGSGLGCRARPRIALGGSLCAVLGEKNKKKKKYLNSVFSKSS